MSEYGPEERYRLYALAGGDLNLLATAPDPSALGVAIVTLHEDAREAGRRLSDLGAFGVLDGPAGDWLVLPWRRGDGAHQNGRASPAQEEARATLSELVSTLLDVVELVPAGEEFSLPMLALLSKAITLLGRQMEQTGLRPTKEN